jgi:hypothetical protein
MVKFSNPSQFDAQYESQQRTVGVSLKPAIGKELFGRQDLVESTGGAFKSHFVTERFIHNDVRKYLLRSSTHWQAVQNEMSSLNAARFDNSHDEGSIYSPLPEAASYRMLAEKVSSNTTVDLGLHLPAGIRENVIARLLHDAGVHVGVDYTSDCSRQSSTAVGYFAGDENRTSDRSQFAVKIDRVSAGSIKVDGFSSSVRYNRFSRHENQNTGKELSSDFATVIDLSDAFSHIVQEKSNSGYIRVLQARSGLCLPSGTEVSMVLAESREASLNSFAERVFLCAAGGFGTSPIWYQQSMATGPPPQRILAE